MASPAKQDKVRELQRALYRGAKADPDLPSGDPKRPWGIDRIDPARGPLVIVEGILDALALARADVQAVALRCKRLHSTDAAAIRAAGFSSVYLGLDATPDVTPAVLANLAGVLADAGITARAVCGPGTGDWGDLLRLSYPELLSAVVAGMGT